MVMELPRAAGGLLADRFEMGECHDSRARFGLIGFLLSFQTNGANCEVIVGMTPLALGTGSGAEERRAVAVVVIGGQALCLLLTLVVTPVAYSLLDDLAQKLRWRHFRLEHEKSPQPDPASAV